MQVRVPELLACTGIPAIRARLAILDDCFGESLLPRQRVATNEMLILCGISRTGVRRGHKEREQ